MHDYKNKILFLILLLLPTASAVASNLDRMEVDKDEVRRWNQFTDQVYQLHKYQLRDRQVEKKTSQGGYYRLDNFYTEERFYDTVNKRLLSRIQWENTNPEKIHMIEVFVYDKQGRVKLDYLSAYLPQSRNAPIQTLINFHYHDKDFSAYRQFDASGNRIYEQCKGIFFGKDLYMRLDEDQIPFGEPDFREPNYNEAYFSCFGDLDTKISDLLNPLNAVSMSTNQDHGYTQANTDADELVILTKQIEKNPQDDNAYVKRGIYYFYQYEFQYAIRDLTRALDINLENDQAMFWRGMAYGRNRQVALGIADLTRYIVRNPNESRAYTKRGVRYIWMGELNKASADLSKAIELDTTNSEAHDDLGVIYAQKKQYDKALYHFRSSLKYDPTYQKAWHNLSLVHHLIQRNEKALEYIDKSLALKSNKDSLLLKSLILEATGQYELAGKVKSNADSIPDNNWSETFVIR